MNDEYKRKNKPNKKSRYKQGYYKLKNPEKYIGDPTSIIYRSTYEYKFCRYCDLTPEILSWSSEPFSIKYFDPINKKERNYHIDFFIRIKKGDKTEDYLVEIKPSSKLVAPILEGRTTLKKLKQYNYELEEFLINKAKAEAAENYAKSMGYKYIIITEEFLKNMNK